MKQDLFQRVVDEVLADLPPELSQALGTVQIVVRGAPTREELKRSGMEEGEVLYGLFEGVALPDKTSAGDQTLPDRVILYRRALEDDFPGLKDLKREIRTTLTHELGHFFGMDEDEIEKRGYA